MLQFVVELRANIANYFDLFLKSTDENKFVLSKKKLPSHLTR